MDVSKNKYKEVKPLKTVETIKGFFYGLSPYFRIEVGNEIGDKLKIYSCCIRLYYKDRLILRSNGKGMTKEYALASGYAELYERFSNELNIDGYFYPYNDDTPGNSISFEEELKYFPQCSDSFDKVKNFIQEESGEPRGCIYKSITNEEEILIDPRHMLIINGTNGMAAGNTLTEALNQGLSELCERYVMTKAYLEKVQFDEIPETLVKKIDQNAYFKIQSIKSKGFDIRFYDASRETGLPVVMSLWIDKTRGIHAVRFGAFPVISIAIERCITENLQGRRLEDSWDFLKNGPLVKPSREGLHRLLTEFKEYLPEDVFIPKERLLQVNKEVYLDNDSTNEDILNRFIEIFKKKGITCYFRETSLCSDMRSVQIHSPVMNKALTTEFLEESKETINRINEFTQKLKSGGFTRTEALRCAQDSTYSDYEFMQFLPYKFKNTYIRDKPLKYIKAVMLYYCGYFERANELFLDLDSDNFLKSYDISFLKTICNYLVTGLSEEKIEKRAFVWGYPKDDIREIINPGEGFLSKYLNDVIFDKNYYTEINIEKEIRNILDKARSN